VVWYESLARISAANPSGLRAARIVGRLEHKSMRRPRQAAA
jgi:hypothetical protein